MIRCSQDSGLPGASAAVGGVHQKILSREWRSGSGRIFLTRTDLGGTRFNFSEVVGKLHRGRDLQRVLFDNGGVLACLQAQAFHVASQQRVCTQTLTPPCYGGGN